ncbi:hypothetical protein BSPWISOXPB_1781 [uncultured Gammaproteobacteria bacterium]|nr:hypothetical protein BSPWISOXPB_1781 [uncultured Gammaproteobacteria bacterium]
MISLNLVLAGLRLGLKNRQVGEKWVSDDYSYLCKGLLYAKVSNKMCTIQCILSSKHIVKEPLFIKRILLY